MPLKIFSVLVVVLRERARSAYFGQKLNTVKTAGSSPVEYHTENQLRVGNDRGLSIELPTRSLALARASL